jgi:hypothetical protein
MSSYRTEGSDGNGLFAEDVECLSFRLDEKLAINMSTMLLIK